MTQRESIFKGSLRAFCTAFFTVVGIAVAVFALTIGLYYLVKVAEKEEYSSTVKLMPDAEGNRKDLGSSAPVLLEIYFKGKIGDDELTASKIENILLKSREKELKDGRVKGILLVINSPGGSANDSDIIYRLISHYKTTYKVPIYAYVDGLCASGGYYIACAADKIFASEVSLVGSVGVLAWPPFFNLSDSIKKIGIEALTLTAGKDKDQLNPTRPWKEGEQQSYQQLINFLYDQFLTVVASNREGLSREKLVADLGAHVYPAPEAKSLGYIDVNGVALRDCLRELALAAGIPADKKYQVISFETKSWAKKLLSERTPTTIKHELDWTSSLRPQADLRLEYLYAP